MGSTRYCSDWGTRLQAGRLRVRDPMRFMTVINLTKPSSLTRPWGFSHPLRGLSDRSRNKECFLGIGRGRCVRLRTSPPSVNLLSRQWGILNISTTYRTPWPVTGVTLLFLWRWCSYLTENTHIGLHDLLRA
jgi:hypothetical protein